jgi:ascorbate-specific PTS system EIIC-type component UlaA
MRSIKILGLRIAGYLWLTIAAVILIYLLWPIIEQPLHLRGPAANEYLFLPLFIVLFFSLPGAILIVAGRRRKR